MLTSPECPKCKAALSASDIEAIGTVPGSPGYPPAFDVVLTCPGCGARMNTFVGIEQFCELG